MRWFRYINVKKYWTLEPKSVKPRPHACDFLPPESWGMVGLGALGVLEFRVAGNGVWSLGFTVSGFVFRAAEGFRLKLKHP